MVLNIPISPETEAALRNRAETAGVDLQTFVTRTLERFASRPTLEESLAPLRAEFEASGMTEDQLVEMLETAKHEMREDRRARRAS
jgi:hypothetical protein